MNVPLTTDQGTFLVYATSRACFYSPAWRFPTLPLRAVCAVVDLNIVGYELCILEYVVDSCAAYTPRRAHVETYPDWQHMDACYGTRIANRALADTHG